MGEAWSSDLLFDLKTNITSIEITEVITDDATTITADTLEMANSLACIMAKFSSNNDLWWRALPNVGICNRF
jgi:hypothetical protein